MREDLFRRICLYCVVVPSLRERFDDLPDEL
jgi:transcriptional regulator with PAS, ATPase and Fis domain